MWERLYPLTILLMFMGIIPFTKSHGDPHWVKFDPKTEDLPPLAIIGGYENEFLYIARAKHDGYYQPGKFVPSMKKTIIPYFKKTYVKDDFEILCGINYKWVTAANGFIPDGAIYGGRSTVDNEPLYVGRAKHEERLIPGKIKPSQKIYLPFGDFEVQEAEYEVLVVSDQTTNSTNIGLHWVKLNNDKVPPPCAIIGGYENEILYIGRTLHNNSLCFGKFVPSMKKTIISHYHQSYIKETSEILCGFNYTWVRSGFGYTPKGAFIGGHSQTDGNPPLYVGRTVREGHLIPGKVKESDRVIYIPYGGSEKEEPHYEILVDGGINEPQIIGNATETTVNGQTVNIKCIVVAGVPLPTISWQFKAKADSMFVSVPGSDSTLNISNVNASDAGTYKCVATNDVGDDEHLTELIVQNPKFYIDIINVMTETPNVTDSQTYAPTRDESHHNISSNNTESPRTTHRTNFTIVIEDVPIAAPYVIDTQTYEPKRDENHTTGTNNPKPTTTIHRIENVTMTAPSVTDSQTYEPKRDKNNYTTSSNNSELNTITHRTNFTINIENVTTVPPPTSAVTGEYFEGEIPSNISFNNPEPPTTTYRTNFTINIENVTTVPPPTSAVTGGYFEGEIPSNISFNNPEPPTTTYRTNFTINIENVTMVPPPTSAVTGGYFEGEIPSNISFNNPEPPTTTYRTNFTINIENVTTVPPPTSAVTGEYFEGEIPSNISFNNPEPPVTPHLPASIFVRDPYWVTFNPDTDALPADAIVGGYENEILYIARASHAKSLTPGKFVPSIGKAIISWGGKTHVKNVIEILCGKNSQWVPTTIDNIPEGSVVGGRSEVNDETLYICRANYSGHLIVGKVHRAHGVCFLPYREQEIEIEQSFEVLVVPHESTEFYTDNGTLVTEASNVTDRQTYTYEMYNNTDSNNSTSLLYLLQPPQIIGNATETAVSGQTVYLECHVVAGVPIPTIRWQFKAKADSKFGSVLGYDSTLNISNVDVTDAGTYKCVATNMVGIDDHLTELVVQSTNFSIDNEFLELNGTNKAPGHIGFQNATDNVQTLQCIIPRRPKNDHAKPLILIPASTWPTSDSTIDYLHVEPGQTVIFSCDNSGGETTYFQKFPEQNVISASCIGQNKYMVEGKPYKISELLCGEVQTVFINKYEKCLSETSELIRVGYEIHGFSEIYEVCFDTAEEIPLYSHVKMSKSNRGGDVTYKWQQYRMLDAHRDTYTCDNAASTCCYTKTQLVNARDVSAGASQRTTFIDPLNAVPHWRPCGMTQSPWENIEDSVRSQIDLYDQIDVWSGTHMRHDNNGTITPKYLWKVLRFDDRKSIAVVYVNGPSPSEADILCKNTCGDDEAVPWSYNYKEHTYCCNVDEFLHAFGLGGSAVGKPTQRSFDMILRKNYSTSNLLLRKLMERTSNIQMTQQINFSNSNR